MFNTEQKRFIDKALSIISKNPFDRLNSPAKSVVEKNNFVCDAHCHIFDGKCVDAPYFLIRLLDIEDSWIKKKIIKFITNLLLPGGRYKKFSIEEIDLSGEQALDLIYSDNREIGITEDDLNELFDELGKEIVTEQKGVMDFDLKNALRRILNVYKMLNQGEMRYVYNQFIKDAVTNTKSIENKDLLTIVLGMDLESGWKGSNIKDYSEQLDELLGLSLEEPIIPFFSNSSSKSRVKNKCRWQTL